MRLQQSSTLFLKIVTVFVGFVILAWLFFFPQFEGRNINADMWTIYFKDPFLVYVYIGATPFFVALYQIIKLLGFIEQDKVFSQTAVKVIQNIKYCALATIGFIAGAELFILFAGDDDNAGAVAMGIYIIFAVSVITTAIAIFERLLQNAVNLKSENDLTV